MDEQSESLIKVTNLVSDIEYLIADNYVGMKSSEEAVAALQVFANVCGREHIGIEDGIKIATRILKNLL